jgi:hypothetical protein
LFSYKSKNKIAKDFLPVSEVLEDSFLGEAALLVVFAVVAAAASYC